MAKVIYSATMSLDGFIAGPGGDMSWLKDHLGDVPDAAADALFRATGAILAGRRTHDGDDPNKGTDAEGAFGGRYDGPYFVLTHRIPEHPVPGVTFVGDLAEAVARAGEAAGDRYVAVLGADVARQCLAAGLLDEIVMFVVPVLLGDGVPMFRRSGGERVRLERRTDAGTGHWYRVVRQKL